MRTRVRRGFAGGTYVDGRTCMALRRLRIYVCTMWRACGFEWSGVSCPVSCIIGTSRSSFFLHLESLALFLVFVMFFSFSRLFGICIASICL